VPSHHGAVIWVPPRTEPDHLRLLPPEMTVREIPSGDEGVPEHPGRGDILVPHGRRPYVRQLAERLENLRVVQTLSAGVDHYLELVPPGVTMCDARGVHDIPVSEWILAAILAMQRDIPRYVRQQEVHTWKGVEEPAGEVNGMEVLILGHGSIGEAAAQRLQAFGATVRGVALHPREGVHGPGELAALLPRADAVVVLLPLTDGTRRMVDAGFIARMKPGALLVNAGRGPTVDMAAVTEAVHDGRIRVALDVTDPEPLPADHPLWQEPGALVTPHVAGSSRAFLARAWRFAGEQCRRYLDGEPLHNVVSEGY
jgi:phosphoglycerate dehydrogenase-like enzyme